jgi:plastocyanin
MSPHSVESHTFTFAKDPKTLQDVAKGFIAPLPGTGTNGPPTLGLSSQAVYPSDIPLPAYDGSSHGDGFLNTGVLDTDPKSPPPSKATVTFSSPGTYQFICLIHPDMHGTVVAQ